jgi:2,3-bisphosphoglycerate-dependent phosphoglycerate mutase
MAAKLVLLRHGQSTWNLENRFTGWTDVDLSEHGTAEAHQAAEELLSAGDNFSIAHTSVLRRAIRTLWIILDAMDLMWIPVERDWRLNERHYGALQGLDKAETAARYGAEQVHLWRRGFAVQPPALALGDPRHPRFDRRYAHLNASQLPSAESLQDTLNRVIPCWHEAMAPCLEQGRNVLVVAHGNSLRALVKYLDHLSDTEIADLNIPTGVPLVYEFSDAHAIRSHYYPGDPGTKEQETA